MKVEGSGTGEATTCKLGGTKEIKKTDITWFGLVTNTQGSGTIGLTWEADLPNEVHCHFSATAAPFTYTSGSSTIHLSKADMTGAPAPCEPGWISATVVLLDSGGAPYILD